LTKLAIASIDAALFPHQDDRPNDCRARVQADSTLAMAGLEVRDGFVAEKICAVPRETQCSWISLAFDDQGRLLAGSEKNGVFRMQAPAPGRSEPLWEDAGR
jgi:hypothetical protein